MYKIELIHTRTFYKRERKPVFEHAHACLTFFTLFDFFKIKTLFFEQFLVHKIEKKVQKPPMYFLPPHIPSLPHYLQPLPP